MQYLEDYWYYWFIKTIEPQYFYADILSSEFEDAD